MGRHVKLLHMAWTGRRRSDMYRIGGCDMYRVVGCDMCSMGCCDMYLIGGCNMYRIGGCDTSGIQTKYHHTYSIVDSMDILHWSCQGNH